MLFLSPAFYFIYNIPFIIIVIFISSYFYQLVIFLSIVIFINSYFYQ